MDARSALRIASAKDEARAIAVVYDTAQREVEYCNHSASLVRVLEKENEWLVDDTKDTK